MDSIALRDIHAYSDQWTKTQIEIWREKIERLGVIRTGALHQSFSDSVRHSQHGSTIVMRFLRYGIYQALGVGRGYEHGNGGDLEILNPDYRRRHGLDKPRRAGSAPGYISSGRPRERRDWYSRKLFMSTMAMAEDLAAILGEHGAHVISHNLDMRSTLV